MAENQEQVDKILSLRERLPHLRLLVYDNPLGMRPYREPLLKSFEAVEDEGRAFGARHPGYFEAAIDAGSPDDLALLAYTSGTTGNPKGVMLSHANLIGAARAFVAAEDIRPGDEWLCYLPMAWIGDALYSTVLSLLVGFACNCPENPANGAARPARARPDRADCGASRLGESADVSADQSGGRESGEARHFRALPPRCRPGGAAARRGQDAPLPLRLLRALGEVLIYGPVRDQLGLRRVRWAYTGGAPLGPDTFRFFRAFGVNLKQIYGATELAGLAALQRDGEASADTVGRRLYRHGAAHRRWRRGADPLSRHCSRATTSSRKQRATR